MDAAFWGPVTGAVAFWGLVAVTGALVTDIGPWYRGLKFPWWKPANWAFGPVWTAVFITAGTGGVIAWRGEGSLTERKLFLAACVTNAIGNVMWSYLFFRRRRPDWALVQVVPFWGTVFWMYWASRPLSYAAGIWFAPYLAWAAVASKLNQDVVKLNGPFSG